MSVNKVILIGNLGSDPEVRYMDGNRVVANFSLATNETYTDRDGNRVTQTEWHRVEMWDGLAKIAEKYLRKGKLIYLEGKIKTDKWTDKDGHDKYITRIRANTMQMLGGADQSAGPGHQPGHGGQHAAHSRDRPLQEGPGRPAGPHREQPGSELQVRRRPPRRSVCRCAHRDCLPQLPVWQPVSQHRPGRLTDRG